MRQYFHRLLPTRTRQIKDHNINIRRRQTQPHSIRSKKNRLGGWENLLDKKTDSLECYYFVIVEVVCLDTEGVDEIV